MSASASEFPELSVVVPIKDEAENLRPLIREICNSLDRFNVDYEIIYVDDGSADSSSALLEEIILELPQLRLIRHSTCFGQSAAIVTGILGARGSLIATIDGDGQNDPKDLLLLLERYRKESDDSVAKSVMVVGHRVRREDTKIKRYSSVVANFVRQALLQDSTPDTGCGLKIFSRASFIGLPRFNHMHRFLPALFIRDGGKVVSVPVNHRAREKGISKYGVWNRLWVGVFDLIGVMWLIRRSLQLKANEQDETRE